MNPKIGYIYKVTNKINGKIYIGQTERTFKERWKGHLRRSGCKYFHNAILKYGKENFDYIILETLKAEDKKSLKELLNKQEIYWIDKYNSTDRNVGYNIQKGGNSGNEGISKITNEQTLELIEMDKQNIPHTQIAKKFNIERKTVTNILRRETNYTKKFQTLAEIDEEEIIEYIRTQQPTSLDVCKRYNISHSTVFKFAKKHNIKFLNYQTRKRLGI